MVCKSDLILSEACPINKSEISEKQWSDNGRDLNL